MSTQLPGFRGEYLWEYDYAQKQMLALAEAFPAERYGWRPAETARSVSEVLVHIGAGGRAFLALLGVKAEPDLYGNVEGQGLARSMAMLAKMESLEKSMTDKADIIALLRKTLSDIRTTYVETSDAELDRPEMFGAETSTVRRLYMRTVCHLHEHMGQLIAYARAMGIPAPWRGEHDAWRKAMEEKLAASKK
jgi:uncharacterized damage-inducible protein DinB